MKIKLILTISALLFFLAACDRPNCTNTNAIFDSNDIKTNTYKQELVKQMDAVGKENLTYWLSNYIEENGKAFIGVNIQGGDLCAKALLQINDWKKLEGIKRTKGVSYIGAQLKGLTFDIVRTDKSIDFIYKNIDNIVD